MIMIPKDIIAKIKLDLRKYLNQKTNYSYNNMKKNLDLIEDEDFFYILIKILKESINELNFETPVYYNKYLLKVLEYLNEEVEINNKNYIVEQLNKIKENINKRITNNKSKTTVAYSNKAFLLSIYILKIKTKKKKMKKIIIKAKKKNPKIRIQKNQKNHKFNLREKIFKDFMI